MKLIPILLLLCAGSLAAADKHVRAGATGTGSGDNWTDAYTALPATLTRGNTYYIADGSYSGYTFNDAESGTTIITIKKATVAEHGSATGWDNTYGDGQAEFNPTFAFTTGYWIIDGVTGGGPDNDWSGSSEYGFRVRLTSNSSTKLIRFDAAVSNIQFHHIDFSYDYNEGRSYPDATIATSQDAVYSLNSVSDTSWSYCRFARAGRTAFLTRATWSNITIEYCYFLDSVHGSQLAQHGEIWSANHALGAFNNITIRYNWFKNFRSTGGLIFSGADEVDIYGNVFETGGGTSGGNGAIGNWSAEPQSVDMRLHHNTFVKMGDSRVMTVGSWGTGLVAYNNVFVGNTQQSIGGTHDYNASDDDLGEANDEVIASTIFVDYAGGNYRLASNTTAGTALAALYDTDMDGNARATPSRGAFEYNGSADATPPGVSAISSGTPSSTGATITWTTDEAANSAVNYGLTASYGSTESAASYVTSHSVVLSGLTAGTTYHYRVVSADATGNTTTGSDNTFVTASSDSTDPAITLDEPDDLDAVDGAFLFSATATDNVAMVDVEFYVDGTLVGTDSDTGDSTFTYLWNSRDVVNGTYDVHARAEDTSGNEAFSATNTITVANAAAGGLVAFYSFSSGAVTTDSANGNTLTLVGSAVGAAGGRPQFALYLDGDNDRATAANSADIDYDGDEITVAAWLIATNTSTWQQGVVKIASTGSNLSAWHIFTHHIDSTYLRPYGQIRNTSDVAPVVLGAIDIPYGEWFHQALVYDGTSMVLYVNGVASEPIAHSGNLKRYTDLLHIGSHGNGTEDLNGAIDEVRIYNRALSAAEIAELAALRSVSISGGSTISGNVTFGP